MTFRLCATLAISLSLVAAGGALAKSAHPVHHKARHTVHRHVDVRYAQGFYDYRAASTVREAFQDGPRENWHHQRHFQGRDFREQEFYRDRQDGRVVENLRSGDFTGGVGYGLNGDVPSFVDGFGQTHFFVGGFRRMAPVPGRFGRFGGPRFGGRFGGGFRGGFR